VVETKRQVLLKLVLVGAAAFLGSYYYFKSSDIGKSKKILKVYAYSSFLSNFGPGPKLAELFEENCNCRIEYMNAVEAPMLIKKMQSLGGGADLVIGLDNFSKEEARKLLKWKAIPEQKIKWESPVGQYVDKNFVAYDWAPLTFIYRQEKYADISSWEELFTAKDLKISLQDPRFSAPGLIFLYWIYEEFGKKGFKDALKKIAPHVHSFSKSWSSAYGLFKAEQVDMSFSYLSSPVFHWVEELDYSFQPLVLKEHPYQIEFVGIPASCQNCKQAESFISLMLSERGQKLIMNKNFMLPVRAGVTVDSAFSELPKLSLMSYKGMNEFLANKKNIIKTWKKVIKN